MMCEVLEVYGVLVTRAQYTTQPIGHLIARECARMDKQMRHDFLLLDPRYPSCASGCNHGTTHRQFPGVYAVARDELLKEPNAKIRVVQEVDRLAETVCTTFLADFWLRLKDGGTHSSNPDQVSFWDLLLALELADPTAHPDQGGAFMVDDRAWLAVQMICTRFGIDFVMCKAQILQARGLVYGARAIATATQRTLATQNLLAFFAEVYGENYGAVDGLNSGHGEPAWKQLDIYAQFVKAAMSTFSNCTNSFTCSP